MTQPGETGTTSQEVTHWRPRATVEACQVTEDNAAAVADWVSGNLPNPRFRCDQYADPVRVVITAGGGQDMPAAVGDWMVRESRSAFRAVPAAEFEETYEPAVLFLPPDQFAIVKAEWDELRDDLRGFLAAGQSLLPGPGQVAVSRDDLDLVLNILDRLADPAAAADARARLSAAVEAGL